MQTMTDDEDQMVKVSELISRLQSTMDQFGDTCVYIRRGGLAWGAVALNRRDDDKKHGVFDLQAQHDRDMLQRAEQVERLIAARKVAETRLNEARTALQQVVARTYSTDRRCRLEYEPVAEICDIATAALQHS
jgi:hypothetical protein